MKIIFLGSSDVSVEFLKEILKKEEIILVISQPAKPAGRHGTITPTPVSKFCMENSIELLNPENLTDNEILKKISEIKPDIGVIVSYGKILPFQFIKIFKYGCMNVHFSLLPAYRGPAPIQWAIINGEERTGVTTFMIDEGVDTGKIIGQKEIKIEFTDTSITLQEKLVKAGIDLMKESLEKIKNSDNIENIISEQKGNISFAPLLKKENGLINWNKSSLEIYNLVRALIPWPVAYTKIHGKVLKIFSCDILKNKNLDKVSGIKPGVIVDFIENEGIVVKTCDGFIILKEVQLEGKKRMKASLFFHGLKNNDKLLFFD